MMSSESQANVGGVQLPKLTKGRKKIKYHFIKSNFFRVVHCDGVWGGLTSHRNIQMTFFNERNAIPQSTELEVTEDGKAIETRQGKVGITRELEVDVVLNIETAKALQKWLEEKIRLAEDLQGKIEKGELKTVTVSAKDNELQEGKTNE